MEDLRWGGDCETTIDERLVDIRQQLEMGRKNILANNQKYYQSATNNIAKSKESVKFWADREERAKQKKRPQLVIEDYKYRRMDRELSLAQAQAVLEAFRPLWVHLGILPEDEVHKKDETLNNGALLQMDNNAHDNADRRQQAIWDGRAQELKTWQAEEEKLNARFATMTNEEIELCDDMEMLYGSMQQIALDDAKFALWRASVNEASAPPAQNPGGLLLEETSPLPAPVTNTDDGEETTPAPSSGIDEETTSGAATLATTQLLNELKEDEK